MKSCQCFNLSYVKCMLLGSIAISFMVKNSKRTLLKVPALLLIFFLIIRIISNVHYDYLCSIFCCLLYYLVSYLSTPLWNFVFVCMSLCTSIREYCSCVMDRPLMINSDSSCCFLLYYYGGNQYILI